MRYYPTCAGRESAEKNENGPFQESGERDVLLFDVSGSFIFETEIMKMDMKTSNRSTSDFSTGYI